MATQKQRSGLVSYTGDSEISDSEDERTSLGNSPPVGPLGTSSLGIPPSKPREIATPPTFVKPEVQSAPVIGLVAYGVDDEEHGDITDLDESVNDEVFLRQQLIQQVNNSSAKSIGTDTQHDSVGVTEAGSEEPNEEIPLIEITDETQPEKEGESEEKDATPLFLPTSGIRLPPEPQAKCSKALQDKIITLLQKKAGMGIDVNANLQNRKDFRNPSIYERLVQLRNLDEFGTNYPPHLFDPHEWDEESYYDNLLKSQRKAYEKKEKAKLERTKIEFVTGTKRPAPMATTSTGVAPTGAVPTGPDALKRRKSKWDIGTGSGVESGGSKSGSPAGVVVGKERPPLLGTAPVGVPLATVGAQAIAQATQLNRELSKLSQIKPK